VIALVSALRNWKSDKAGPPAARWARRNLALVGALNLAFVLGFVSVFAANMNDIAFALPKGLYAVLTLPLLALVFTALAAFLVVRVWRESYWTRGARVLHSAGVVAAIAFVWFLNFWNLLGYRIG
jgi:glucan phosphoethanolaminetransferase (alkaline phosphatase superfamily)